jgi:hypothetical protein
MALVGTYRSEGIGSSYVETTVQIIGSSSGTFNLGRGGVTFRSNTQERDQFALWSGMTAEFTLMIEDFNNSAVNTFIDDLSGTGEDKYFVKVIINGETRFIGFIQSEGSNWADNANTREFIITAYDGLGRLDGKEYATDGGAPYGGYETIEKSIYNCLQRVGTIGQFGGETFLMIVHGKVADGQTVSGNPMKHQRVDQLTWYDKGNDPDTNADVNSYKTCKEVLTDILVAYGLCIKYVGPHFLIYEPHLLGGGGTAYKYDSGGGYTGSGAFLGHNISILNDHTLDADRMGGSGFSALPPMYRSVIRYDHGEQDVNMLYGVEYKGDNAHNGASWAPADLGTITVRTGEKVVLQFSGKLRTKSVSYPGTYERYRNHRYHFRIHLFVKYNSNTQTAWWEHKFQPYDFFSTSFSNFNNPRFNYDSYQTYDIVTDIRDKFNSDVNIFSEIGFDTQLLVEGYVHHVWWGFEFVRVFDELLYLELAGAGPVATVFPASNPVFCEWEFNDLSLTAIEDGNILKRPIYTETTSYGNIKNDLFYKQTTHIGDGPGKTSVGRLQALIDGDWKDTISWSSKRLHQKAADEIQGARNTAVKVLTGGFYGLSYWYDGTVTYQGIVYMAMSVQYNSGSDLWEGEWVQFMHGSLGSGKKNKVRKKERVPLPDNPNKLPDDERLQDRIIKIHTGSEGFVTTDSYTEIALRDPARYDMWREGDKINIIDPVIGYVDSLTLTADVLKDDTSIFIESWTPDHEFPPTSYLELDYQYEQSIIGTASHKYWQIDEDFSGTTWPITISSLPAAALGRAEISKRITLSKNGQILYYLLDIDNGTRYEKGYQLDSNNIVFLEPCDHNVVQIIFEK